MSPLRARCLTYSLSLTICSLIGQVTAAKNHLTTLQLHRAHTLEVLRNIQLRESVLAELHAALQSSNVGDLSVLMTLMPLLREHTVAVCDAVYTLTGVPG